MSCAFIAGPMAELPIFEFAPLPALPALPPAEALPALPPLADAPDAEAAPEAAAADRFDEVSADPAAPTPYAEGAALGIVSSMLSDIGAQATGAMYSALDAVGRLSLYQANFSAVTAPAIDAVAVTLAPLGAAPPENALDAAFASAPEAPGELAVAAIEIGAAPDYAVAEINLMDIPLPDPLDALLPAEPQLDPLGVALEPDFVLPPVPTLFELALPDAPTLVLPLLDATTLNAPDAPSVEFAYTDIAYSSVLLDTLNRSIATLVADMSHSGIAAPVEQAIWERAADREALLTHRATGEAVRLLRSRGFQLPEATMVRIVQQALQGGLNRAASFERDVAIEQSRLRQANFKFALDTSVALEARMMEKHNAAQARALEAAKATVEAQIQIFNARVQLYAADVAAFGIKAQAFRARVEAALQRIGIYKAELEAARVIGEINSQRVLIYKSRIDGVRSTVEIFKTRVDAAKTQIAGTKSTIEAYRSRILAFESQVTAKAADYEAYAARVKGQAAKAGLFGKQVDAYKSRVGAFDSLVKAQIGAQTLRFKQANEFPLDLYKARTDAYRTGVAASVEQLKSVLAQFTARIKAFSIAEGAKSDHVEAELKQLTTAGEAALATANLMLTAGQQNMALADIGAQTAQGNLRSAGQLAGQLAASAMAAQSVHASISESGSFGASNSASGGSSNARTTSAVTSVGSSSATNTSHSSTSGRSINSSSTSNEGRSYNKGVSSTTSTHTSNNSSTQLSVKNSSAVTNTSGSSFSQSTECTDRTNHKA